MIPKVIINGVLKLMIKQFKLDKLERVYDYVFGKNELDYKYDELNKRMKKVESIAHEPKEFVSCKKCNDEVKEEKKWYDK